ncbi:MAG: hypothetical protein BGP04_25025 [Rhizobiales bacterium 62-17]|nr:MAG: hypothetical protein BGP04_25025 [Rhizobiales bacterium 62-17]
MHFCEDRRRLRHNGIARIQHDEEIIWITVLDQLLDRCACRGTQHRPFGSWLTGKNVNYFGFLFRCTVDQDYSQMRGLSRTRRV